MNQQKDSISESTMVAEQPVVSQKDAVEQDDFLAGVQAADAESFNVCISCD